MFCFLLLLLNNAWLQPDKLQHNHYDLLSTLRTKADILHISAPSVNENDMRAALPPQSPVEPPSLDGKNIIYKLSKFKIFIQAV